MNIVIIGGGAAGFFAAIAAKIKNKAAHVTILEKSAKVLSKVKISGGGRCNVTHHLFDPKEFVKHYPRGSKELLQAFYQFSSKDTVEFFTKRGVKLKTEEDNRMFPVSDSSEEIISTLVNETKTLGISLHLRAGVDSIQRKEKGFLLRLKDESIFADKVLIATGSAKPGFELAKSLGHTIEPLIPSLFALNIENFPYQELSGISCLGASISFKKKNKLQKGPLLITHFGLSGPAALKLSAFGAKEFYESDYDTTIYVNWISKNEDEVFSILLSEKNETPKISIGKCNLFDLAKNLWLKILERAAIDPKQKLKDIQEKKLRKLSQLLCSDALHVKGKTTNKSEFVTCGGICLKEVEFKTMQSRVCENLFFAGEVLDIDGITGGFNFQNAWTTGYIAGTFMGEEQHEK